MPIPANYARELFKVTILGFILFTTVVGRDIESYDDLCRECQKHKSSYRLRGWVCWTACRSQNNYNDNFKQTEIQNESTTTMEATTKKSRSSTKKKIKTTTQFVINITEKPVNLSPEMYNSNWTLSRYLSNSYLRFLLEPSKLIEVFKKARCIFPKDLDSITRALLLQQCLSHNHAQGNETTCYEELGCFPMDSPWVSLFRPFPTPHTPDDIDVKLYLYTRNSKERFYVPLWPEINLEGSDFDINRDKTVFITHGFASNGNVTWMENMKEAYLKHVDANLFLVDWGKGASHFNYLQVASNTRIVGAELARFGKYLLKKGLKAENLHLIGHSLGSHISAYMAKKLSKISKPGRITALDPAQPGFETEAKEVRLDTEDAEFVDVLHTDAKPFIPFVGFGLLLPAGHVDFYLNDGTNQPGCLTDINIGKIKSIYDLAEIPVEVLSQWVSCSHGRAYEVFTEALLHENSCLWARKIPFFANLIRVTAQGALRLFNPFLESWDTCTSETCSTLGLITSNLKARGVFALSTTAKAPYCVTDEERDRKIRNVLSLGLASLGSKIKDGLSGLFSSFHNV